LRHDRGRAASADKTEKETSFQSLGQFVCRQSKTEGALDKIGSLADPPVVFRLPSGTKTCQLVFSRYDVAARPASASVQRINGHRPHALAPIFMHRIDLAAPGADARLDTAIAWLNGTTHNRYTTIAVASVDASFRRYFRVTDAAGKSAIVMDAPPPQENVRPFINVLQLLQSGDIHVPKLHAQDVERGFLLLDDLGRNTYLQTFEALPSGDPSNAATINSMFCDAIDSLVKLQRIDPLTAATPLGRYDTALLRRDVDLFPEWYLGRHLALELSDDEKNALERCYALLISSALAQPTVLVHRDYMPRNLMTMTEGNPGVIDFQDAVVGPIAYDIAALMRDAFVSWPEPLVIDWVVRYWEGARKVGLPVRDDFSEFYREFEWMGLQRHLKVMGIFARINYRDGKPRYLADTPRFVAYARHVGARYAAFAPLLRLFDRIEGKAVESGYTF
jgi:N-acetylmuramate 1-kinase